MLRTLPRITILNNYSPKWYRGGKWHDSQRGFIHFHPIYYLKGDRALGNSILRNSSSECQNQDQHSLIARTRHRLELFTKWCHWKAVCEGSLWKWPSSTIFKNADPGPFYHYFFYCLLHTRTLITLTFHLHICRDGISPSQIYINTIRISRGKIRKRAYLKKSMHGRG